MFKVGDKVYYPEVSNKVLTLKESLSPEYPLETNWTDLSGDLNGDSFTENGRRSIFSLNPCIFPATQEWYEKLVHIYPDLEKPPVKTDPKEIIQVLLNDGNEGVLCWVSDGSTKPCSTNVITIITRVHERYVDFDRNTWLYATPIYPIKSLNQTIIDFVDGEVVLEKEYLNEEKK